MSSRNDSEAVIASHTCCHCQNLSRGWLIPGYSTPCQHCQHVRCTTCIDLKSGGLDQNSSYGPTDSTAFPIAFAAAPAPTASQPPEGPSAAPRASTEPRADDLGSTLKGQDLLSIGASPSSLKSATTYGILNTAPNLMLPPPRSSGLAGELQLKNHAGHIPNILMHPTVASLHGGLSHTRIGDFSLRRRTPRRPMPLHIAERRDTTPGTGSMQSPTPSGTSAYFSESVMSNSPSQSNFGYLPSDHSTTSLHRDDSLTGAELPLIPPMPSAEPSWLAASGPRRPPILSEKSPRRPIHRKPKASPPPRVVNPDDPKDFKTAQNTIAARGTRKRKTDSANWLMRYRDDTKVYIRELEASFAESNERVAILERENLELRQALSLRPGSDSLARYAQYPNSPGSKHGSFNDLQTPHQHREIVPMQVPGDFPVLHGFPSIEDYLPSMRREQSNDIDLTLEPLTARPYDHRERSATRQFDPNASVHDSPQQEASKLRTARDESMFVDVPPEASDPNPPTAEPPVSPSTAYNWEQGHVISWSEAQDQFEMDDYEFFGDPWYPYNDPNAAQVFGSPPVPQNNVEEGQIPFQA